MNILMMTNSYLPRVGGVANSVDAFTEQYRRKGHRTIIVAPDYEGKDKNEQDVIRLPSLQHCSGIDYSLMLPIPGFLEAKLSDFKPDIIHSHHPFFIGSTAQRFSVRLQTPLVFTHHTRYELYTHYTPIKPLNMKNFIISLSRGYENLCDAVIAPSESIKQILLKRGVSAPVEVIPTGVDFEKFRNGSGSDFRQKFDIPADVFLSGYIGRITEEKNLTFLSRAVAPFLREQPDTQFLFAGKGPVSEKLKEYFRNRDLQDRVHFTGSLTGQDLVNAYHSLDAFVFTSKSETQGMVLTEAMAASTPVISLDATGTREVVQDGKNGYLIQRENTKEFADALNRLKNLETQERNALRAEARRTAEDYSILNCTENMLRLYERLKDQFQAKQQISDNVWAQAMEQAKTEWSMFKNAFHAFEQALAGK